MANKMKKLLTIEDLIEFCRTMNFSHFDSTESGYRLAIHIPATFEQIDDDKEDNDHVGMMKLKIKIFHTGLNRNKSYISDKAAIEAMSTIKNRPVLAYIHQLYDGSWDFGGHDMETYIDDNDNEELIYLEQQIGSFDSEDAFFEYDEENKKNFVCAYAYIPEEYTRACEIIRDKGATKNSVELSVGEISYNVKEKYLELNSFYISGSTLLGSDYYGNEIQEGMLGSRADIVDFSIDNNSILNSHRNMSNINMNLDVEKGGNRQMDPEVIFEKHSIAKEDTTVGCEFGEKTQSLSETSTDNEDEAIDEEVVDEEFQEDDENDEESQEDDENDEESQEDDENDENDKGEKQNMSLSKTLEYSIKFNGEVKTFSLNLSDIQYALENLVNTTYAEKDNVWLYKTEVYIDESYVVMIDYWGHGPSYKQSYICDNNNFQLVGDRLEVRSVWLTEDEENGLNTIRSEFSIISKKLEKYELSEQNAEKIKILESSDYNMIREDTDFKKLVAGYTQFSIDQIRNQCDTILLEYIKKHQQSVKDELEKKKAAYTVTPLPNTQKKKSRYGNLFSK